MSKQFVIVDLDGTVCDGTHRLHLLPKGAGATCDQWVEFNKACINDTPIQDTIDVVNALADEYYIVLLTGRGEQARPETLDWLLNTNLMWDYLFMRPADDHRQDTVFKEEVLRRLGLDNILCCFDDNPRVIKHFRSLGLTCYAVCSYEDENRKDLRSLGTTD